MKTFKALNLVKESLGQIHGCKIAREASPITHLFFAGNCFFYFKVNEAETRTMRQTLLEYGLASGQ